MYWEREIIVLLENADPQKVLFLMNYHQFSIHPISYPLQTFSGRDKFLQTA